MGCVAAYGGCHGSKCRMFSRLTDQYEEASLHLWELLEGRDKAVAGTTCKLFHPRPVLEGGGGAIYK